MEQAVYSSQMSTVTQRRNSGFTLLEILIALVLFTVGVVALVWAFTVGLAGNIDAEKKAVAMVLAEKRMEELRNLAYGSIDDEARTDVSGFSGFEREVAVTEPETDLKEATVAVYCTYKGAEASTSLVSYISKN